MNPRHGILGVDIETSSACDIKFGAWAYSQHPSTIVYCVVFAHATRSGDYATIAWQPGDELPQDVVDYLEDGGLVLAHNVGFERSIWENILRGHWFPPIAASRWRDTQALGRALNLPSSLEGLARALGCPVQKDLEGGKLMRAMATATPADGGGWSYPHDTPANRERLREYCAQDVAATLDCYFRMPALSKAEAAVWRVDQGINYRGVYLDRAFADQCSAVTAARKRELDDEAFHVTAGELANSTAAPALKRWLVGKGVELPLVARKRANGATVETASTDKAAVAQILSDQALAADVRAVLENRQEANKATSLAKLERVGRMIGGDGRLRFALQFEGAHTGRWTSSGLQIHNLPKDKMSREAGELVRAMLKRGSLDGLKIAADQPLAAISQSLRSVIAAPPGREIIAADYSAIEARVVAWLAGQGDVVQLFRDGVDVYTYAAENVGSADRQLGKVCVLALGYGMGAIKFADTAAAWGIPLELGEAQTIQRAWREANDRIVGFWETLEEAVRDALADPGETFLAGRIAATCCRDCLALRLPSGRVLRYWRPWTRTAAKLVRYVDDDGHIAEAERISNEVGFWGMGPDRRSMVRESTYGGKLVENVTQAVARDLLAEALVRLDGVEPYDVVMHVHDSIAAEVPEGAGDVGEFCEVMAATPPWAEGLPIAVEGYRDRRFRG